MTTIVESEQLLRKLLRDVARDYPPPRPAALETWWQAEQARISEERAAREARRAARRAELETKIAALQAELAGL